MSGRRFWVLVTGLFPVLLIAVTVAPLLDAPEAIDESLVPFVLLAEIGALWFATDPQAATAARGSRVVVGLAMSIVTAILGGGLLIFLALVLAYGL